MHITFIVASFAAVLATVLALTRSNSIHALLYLVLSLLSTALIFFTLGAPFVAALEVILYAGAIMVLFVFVVMMLPAREQVLAEERARIRPLIWILPLALAGVLLAELLGVFSKDTDALQAMASGSSPEQVAAALFGPYALGVELASFLLLAALVGAVHLSRGGGKRGEAAA